jgi:hypothetical protein
LDEALREGLDIDRIYAQVLVVDAADCDELLLEGVVIPVR